MVSDRSSRSSRIIFGSCNSQYYDQPFWTVIKDRNPTAFVWTGDAVYADDRQEEELTTSAEYITDTNLHQTENTRWWSSLFHSRRRSKNKNATPEYLRQLYQEQLRQPDYRDLLLEDVSVFGTLDDHDYGINNGDKTFPFRRESGIEYIRFLGLDMSSAMAKRATNGLGVYGVQVYDFSSKRHPSRRLLSDEEAGLDPDVVVSEVVTETGNHPKNKSNNDDNDNDNESDIGQLVAIFVLDVRTNKTPYAKTIPDRFSLDPAGDFLGEDQWKWFETAIGRSKANVNIGALT